MGKLQTLSGIVSLHIRQKVAAMVEKKKHKTSFKWARYYQESRKTFLKTTLKYVEDEKNGKNSER